MFFAEPKISRQRRWQLKKLAQKKCMICGNKEVFKRGMCFEHYKKYLISTPSEDDPTPEPQPAR